MKIACAQMNVRLGDSAYNFAHAEELVRKAAAEGADVVMLPETWNLGFFPREKLAELADPNGEQGTAPLRHACQGSCTSTSWRAAP